MLTVDSELSMFWIDLVRITELLLSLSDCA